MKLTKPAAAALAAITVLALGACGDGNSEASDGWTPGAGAVTGSDTDAPQDESPDAGETSEPGATTDPGSDASDEGDDEAEADDPAESPGAEVTAEQISDLMLDAYEAIDTARMRTVTSTAGTEMVMDGLIDYTTSPLTASMTMQGGPSDKIEIRMVDGKMYMSMGKVTGGKFIVLDPADKNSPFGDLSDLEAMSDPAQAFQQYAAGFTGGVFVGEEDVDGVETDHYKVTVDLSKVPSMAELTAEAGGKFEPMTMDLWLDDEGRPVATASAMTFMGVETTSRTEMSDFGVSVDVKAPAPSEITKYPGS